MGISSLRFSLSEACKDRASVTCRSSSAKARIFGTMPQVDTVMLRWLIFKPLVSVSIRRNWMRVS